MENEEEEEEEEELQPRQVVRRRRKMRRLRSAPLALIAPIPGFEGPIFPPLSEFSLRPEDFL